MLLDTLHHRDESVLASNELLEHRFGAGLQESRSQRLVGEENVPLRHPTEERPVTGLLERTVAEHLTEEISANLPVFCPLTFPIAENLAELRDRSPAFE